MKPMAKLLMENISDDREKWREMRKGKLGSSEVVTIAGLNKYKSPLELWAEKTGKVKDEFTGNLATRYGQLVEPAIREIFTMAVPGYEVTANDATYQHDEFPFAIATPDSWVKPTEEDDKRDTSGSEQGLLELKHTSVSEGWDDGAPDSAHCQLIWQLGILNLDWGFIAGVVKGRPADIKTPFFRYDKDLFNQLMDMALKFMDMVEKDIPPDAGPGDKELIYNLVEREEAGEMAFDETVIKWVERYDTLTEEVKAKKQELSPLTSELEAAKNNIIKLMGHCAIGLLPDGRKVKLGRVAKEPYMCTPKPYWLFKIK